MAEGMEIKEGLGSPEEVLDYTRRRCAGRPGLEAWEVYLEEEDSLTIEVREGEVESLSAARSRGLAVRVLSAGRLGFSFTNSLVPADLRAVVEQAVAAAGDLSEDGSPGFMAPPVSGWPSLQIEDRSLARLSREEKIKRAMALEASALGYDPRVKRVRGAEYEEVLGRVWIENSAGLSAFGALTLVSASVEAVAEDKGEAQSGFEFETVHYYDMLNQVRVGAEAARKAVALLGGKPLAPGRYPVMLSAEAAAGLISVLAPAVCGDAVAKQRSWLEGQRGQRVASPAVTLMDDGLCEAGPAAFPFDDEGAVSRATTVIREGVLENFLYDSYYGAKTGAGSSGNGLRSSYFLPPGVDTTNWVLSPGRVTEGDLIRQVDRGVLIVDFLGLHTADPVTGEFSLGAQGFRLEGGRVGEPVTGIALAGKLSELLDRVEAVSDKIRFSGDTGAPAVLIGQLDISG
jgi:PmbA protein